MMLLLGCHSEGQQLIGAAWLCFRLHSRAGLHRGVTTAPLGISQLQGHSAHVYVINDHMSCELNLRSLDLRHTCVSCRHINSLATRHRSNWTRKINIVLLLLLWTYASHIIRCKCAQRITVTEDLQNYNVQYIPLTPHTTAHKLQ